MFGLFLFFLHHQAARSWNAVRHVCLFCQAVQPGVVYVAPSAPYAHATTQFDSSAANVGQGACGVRLGIRGLMRLSVFFYLPCEKIACDSRGEDGRCNTSAVTAPNSGAAPQLTQSSSVNWTMTHVQTLWVVKYANMNGQLSLCSKLVIFISIRFVSRVNWWMGKCLTPRYPETPFWLSWGKGQSSQVTDSSEAMCLFLFACSWQTIVSLCFPHQAWNKVWLAFVKGKWGKAEEIN